ncbi:hypothetical protein [uncultured Formosa sp.]|nr:hypothetical protein [uncultured Formosa sp.]
MKPTSNQNARIGKVMKPSHIKTFNFNGLLNRIDNSRTIVTGLKTK